MRKTEKVSKRYGCSKGHLQRALMAHMFIKLEDIGGDSSGVSIRITEAEILQIMKDNQYPFRKRPQLHLIQGE